MKTATVTKKKTATAGDIFAKGARVENLSTITKALEEAHAIIAKETGAPRATIVTGRSATVHGHFTPWTPWASGEESFHEIFITIAKREAREMLGTLLHETAHSIDNKEGVKGTSGDGYHNQKFKARAESLGLTITQAPRIGFSVTSVSDECVARWQKAHDLIEEALRLTADSGQGTAKPKGRNKNLLVAECDCGEKIRLSAKTLKLCAPRCQNCFHDFEVKGE
jgi:secreted PhoX family phosphatase